jgi:hypothetical protein
MHEADLVLLNSIKFASSKSKQHAEDRLDLLRNIYQENLACDWNGT